MAGWCDFMRRVVGRNRALPQISSIATVAVCLQLSVIAVVKAEGIYPGNVSDKNSSTPQAPAPIVVAPGITLYPALPSDRGEQAKPPFIPSVKADPRPITDPAFYSVGHLIMSENDQLCPIFDKTNFKAGNNQNGQSAEQIRFPDWQLQNKPLPRDDTERHYWASWDIDNSGRKEILIAIPVHMEDLRDIDFLTFGDSWEFFDPDETDVGILLYSRYPQQFLSYIDADSTNGVDDYTYLHDDERFRKISTSSYASFSGGTSFHLYKIPEPYKLPMRGKAKSEHCGSECSIVDKEFGSQSIIAPFSFKGANYFFARGYRDMGGVPFRPSGDATVIGVVFELRPDGNRNDLCYYATLPKQTLDNLAASRSDR